MCHLLSSKLQQFSVEHHIQPGGGGWWSRDSLFRVLDSLSKDCKFKSRQELGENFLLQSPLCADSYLVAMLLQWHVKYPGHSAKSSGGRLHLNRHSPLTHQSRSGLTKPPSRQSVGIYQKMSSHATHQGTLSHSCLRSLCHCGLILA